ncbi:Protein Red, partial [Schistosoma japonicum]
RMTDFIESVSNPLAPDVFVGHGEFPNHKLSNSDFRKLLMTPKPSSAQPSKTDDAHETVTRSSTHHSERSDRIRQDPNQTTTHRSKHKPSHKRHHGRSKKDIQKSDVSESVHRYRDRAKERRDGKLAAPTEEVEEDRELENDDDTLTRTADYRAVAPSSAAGASHAERRRMLIQESKYLGGDMEHTHLVKGLDYVLLQKVRLEIQNKEIEAEQALDDELNKPDNKIMKESSTNEEGIQYRTHLAANICNVLFNERLPERNEYFQPGRMAYRIELEDDSVDFEVPATVIRSKSDCLQIDGRGAGGITTNEIVINKLTQILSYLRAGKRHAKKAKLKGRVGAGDFLTLFLSQILIYLRVLEMTYLPTVKKHGKSDGKADSLDDSKVSNSHNRLSTSITNTTTTANNNNSSNINNESNNVQSSYFDIPANSNLNTTNSLNATKEFLNELSQRFGVKDESKLQEKASLERFFAKTQVTCYDECYPGFAESYDAMGDSDDEADFSKMDLGNKKGPVGRWDFETQEEYSDYMSNKEALPKAAFQYGVKMADGRRTRRIGPKDEKAELDRQLQKIQSIIQKRKQLAEDGGPVVKNPRF